ncbi:MAG: NAD(P)/FAD-dependent oxidoreductase [Thermodesulfovibrionia bacterium]|nr:NAD(P)/FAD-dependent oxidoreductase [Thermodesulfovibrionia bacterium]
MKDTSKRRVVVIGAGAAGLMAAGQAAIAGAETLLFESMRSPGRKLRISGKGRCNLTNTASQSEFISHFNRNGRFLRQAFSKFFSPELLAFFNELGIETVIERGGRVFPASGQAQDIVDALTRWAVGCGVKIINSSPVRKLVFEDGNLTGVETAGMQGLDGKTSKSKVYISDAVIIATGGISYPGTGSTGDGYKFAESAGHKIIPLRPALVPLQTSGDIAQRMQGLSLKNVTVRTYINGKKEVDNFGEMLFTHFGVSGPVILSMSGRVVDAILNKDKVSLSIDLKPALDEEKLDARLLRDLNEHGKQKYKTMLKELLPAKMIPVCTDLTGISPDKTCHQITADERKRLKLWLKDLRLEINGYRPVEEAIVTAGGVDIKEVDPRTMCSKLVNGLYFAGEVLDINADTGGYNLQAAFSTGWLAGRSAAG